MIRNGTPKFFIFQKLFRTEFRGFFSSKNGSERNSEVFLIQKWFVTKFQRLPRNGLEQNSQGFSLQRNGSERNSEFFLNRETGGIPTELLSVKSCSVFRGIIFLSENGNPNCKFRYPSLSPLI
jgi:hypothetical protein